MILTDAGVVSRSVCAGRGTVRRAGVYWTKSVGDGPLVLPRRLRSTW